MERPKLSGTNGDPWYNPTMELVVYPAGRAEWDGGSLRCALGRSGVSRHKREGDSATPVGCYAMRRVLYRPDRGGAPQTGLPVAALASDDGWCDDPEDGAYNNQVRLPHPAHCEELWRDDRLYDLIVVLGHNDEPVEAGRGSGIFLHLAQDDYAATEGCIALAEEDLRAVLSQSRPGDAVRIEVGEPDRSG